MANGSNMVKALKEINSIVYTDLQEKYFQVTNAGDNEIKSDFMAVAMTKMRKIDSWLVQIWI